jgi:hypothetical protein
MDGSAGDDCVVNLDLSPWVSLLNSSNEAQDQALLAVKLKASSGVNSCSPHMVRTTLDKCDAICDF